MPSVKNIGKPYAGKRHVRFDEGGQVRASSLLYLFTLSLTLFTLLILYAGVGDDVAMGERGNDTIYLEDGNDKAWGDEGNAANNYDWRTAA